MNPPTATPRTDAAVIASRFQAVPFNFQYFARALETELAEAKAEAAHYMSVAQKATDELAAAQAECERLKFASEGHLLKTIQQQAELAAEREKVRVLRSALERRHDEQSYYCQYVEDALAATKEDSR